jgi:excisionase family DNA binding protein
MQTHKRQAYRVKEVTEILGLPKSTVYALIRRGDLTAVHPGEGHRILLVPVEEIDQLLGQKNR